MELKLPAASIVIAIVGTGLGLIVAGVAGIVDTIVGPYQISITQDSGASRGGYRRYVNARFGFSVTIPVELTITTHPDNDDGLELTSSDRRTRLTLSAGCRVDATDAAALLADQSTQVTRGGGRITYSTHSTDSFTLSGFDSAGRIFHEHSSIGPSTIATAYWLYSKTDQARWKSGSGNHQNHPQGRSQLTSAPRPPQAKRRQSAHPAQARWPIAVDGEDDVEQCV